VSEDAIGPVVTSMPVVPMSGRLIRSRRAVAGDDAETQANVRRRRSDDAKLPG